MLLFKAAAVIGLNWKSLYLSVNYWKVVTAVEGNFIEGKARGVIGVIAGRYCSIGGMGMLKAIIVIERRVKS